MCYFRVLAPHVVAFMPQLRTVSPPGSEPELSHGTIHTYAGLRLINFIFS